MTNDDGEVIAVLDWEICTLGDPLADVGLLMAYWTEADDAYGELPTAPTTVEGFLTRNEVLHRYAQAPGHDHTQTDFQTALHYAPLASLFDDVYARSDRGALRESPSSNTARDGKGGGRQIRYRWK